MSVSIVIPVYNEAENIEPLADEICSLSSIISSLDVIFVDDGSTDQTWENLEHSAKRHACLRAIRCERNHGQSSALLIGMHTAKGEVLVTMDGDRQNNPADIPALISHIQYADVVCGYRANRKDSWARRKGSKVANGVRNWATHDNIKDTGCSLKAFKRECIGDLPPVDGMHRFMPSYFRLNDRIIREIQVDHRPRTHGVSKYTNMSRLPKTVGDLISFMWYKRRYLKAADRTNLLVIE